MNKKDLSTIDIETKTIFRFWITPLLLVIVAAFLYKIRVALAMVGCAILLAIAIQPLAKKIDTHLGRKKNSKPTLSSILAYSLVLIVIAFFLATVAPIVVSETTRFFTSLPGMISASDSAQINAFGSALGVSDLASQLSSALESLSTAILSGLGSSLVSGIGTIGGIVTNVVVTLIMSLFFLLEGPEMIESFWNHIGARKRPADAKDLDEKRVSEARKIVDKMAWVISTFFNTKVVVAIINGIAAMILIAVLTLIFKANTSLAVPLGMICIVFCIIPMFGQFIAGVSVTLILLLNNPFMALIWVIYYSIYSTIESNVFEPKIQGNALELRPVIVLVAATIGTYAMGFLGTIIAIPIAGCIKVLLDEYPTIKALK